MSLDRANMSMSITQQTVLLVATRTSVESDFLSKVRLLLQLINLNVFL